MSKELVQKQFGSHARAYATSEVHAKGASLARLVELVQPEADWEVLDVATAAGHTAFAFAPHVRHVVASDITPEMLPVAAELAEEKGLKNITMKSADAEKLSFDDDQFDLVTCRIAAHHFPHVDQFLSEAHRVLRRGGLLAVVDNVVPGSGADDETGNALRAAGAYVNAFEKLRDPGHGRCLSVAEWLQAYSESGFEVIQDETAPKRMLFDPWVRRLGATEETQQQVRDMLENGSQEVMAFLHPEEGADGLAFYLTEGIFVGRSR